MRFPRPSFSLLLLTAIPVLSNGQSAPAPASTREDHAALLRVVAESPALNAASRRTSAARARVDAAGRLANPEVEGMTSRMNGPMGERSTMYELNVRQPLPRRGERAADRDRARAGVVLAEADYAVMAGELAADTAQALAESEAAAARVRLKQAQLGRLDAVLRTLEARLAAGVTGRIADRLTVQSRVASLQLQIEEERTMAADALAEARGRLGLQPDAALPAFAAPTSGDVSLTEAAGLRVAAARADEASAQVKVARASGGPMTAVGLRLERERTGIGDEDTVGLAFMSEIPWRSRGYARAEVRAAEAERAAAESEAVAARYRISSALSRAGRADRLAETARRLSGETLSRVNAEYDAMIRSAGVAGSGASTVLETVELLEKAADTELQTIQADLAARRARAELWRYLPASRFSPAALSSVP